MMMRKNKIIIVVGVIFLMLIIVIMVFMHFRNVRRPNPIFYESKYVAHGQYLNDSLPPNSMSLFRHLVEDLKYKFIEVDVQFTLDTVPVLCHDWNICNIATDANGKPANIVVEQTTYCDLCKYNFAKNPKKDKWHKIDLFKDIVNYAKEKNVCVQIDIQKWTFPKEYCRILYDIVADADMLNSVVWEISDGNIRTFAMMDPFLNYMLDGKWTHDQLDSYLPMKYWSSLLIFLHQFHKESDYDKLDYQDIIEYGHKNGYLMMNAVINDSTIADSLFSQGVDLMDTGCLK